jgi:hypothetical protein
VYIPPIVARQRLGKNPLIVVRQRLSKNSPILAGQRLGRNVAAITDIHATPEELLDASFSMWPESYQGKDARNYLITILTIVHYILLMLMTIMADNSVRIATDHGLGS